VSDNPYLPARAGAVVAAFESALDLLSPRRRRSKKVTVPDFVGMGTHELLYQAMRVGVKVEIERLSRIRGPRKAPSSNKLPPRAPSSSATRSSW
jgi:hypothetical protein